MPLLDLPLDQLLAYRGRTPRPEDFDAYWATALAELDRTPPAPELTPGDFAWPGARCQDLWFAGTGGARIHAKYLCPEGPGPFPTICIFHGYAGNAGGWFDKLPWIQAGFAVAAMDCRGQGGRSTDPGGVAGTTLNGHIIRGLDDPDPQRLYYRHVFLDTAQLVRALRALPGTDAARMGAFGFSQGGALTLACAALVGDLKRIAPVYPFLCDYRRVWEMDQAKDAYAELRTWFRQFDPRHEREDAVFRRLAYIDCQHLAPRIRAETLWTVGLMDSICPPSTQFAAYNRIPAAKDLLVYPDYGHEVMPDVHERIAAFLRGI
jgi:cephalosporin-C deacetylase